MENSISREIRETFIKSFMRIIILSQLDKAPMGGYDIVKVFYKRYKLLLSSGTIYSCLYAMERNGLVKGMRSHKKRIYRIGEKGRVMLGIFRNDKEKMLKTFSDILK